MNQSQNVEKEIFYDAEGRVREAHNSKLISTNSNLIF